MTFVSSSSIMYSVASTTSIIGSLPIVATRLTPTPWALAMVWVMSARAPLCSATPTGPAMSGGAIGTPYAGEQECVLKNPRQFGPSRMIPCDIALATRDSSAARPSGPFSR